METKSRELKTESEEEEKDEKDQEDTRERERRARNDEIETWIAVSNLSAGHVDAAADDRCSQV